MANITVFEFFQTPNAGGIAPPLGVAIWPADKSTAGATGGTVTLTEDTQLIVVCADVDCRMRISKSTDATAAAASDIPILGKVPNTYLINKRLGQTLRFV